MPASGTPTTTSARTGNATTGRAGARRSHPHRRAGSETGAPALREDEPEYRVAAVGRPPETCNAPGESQRRSAETPPRFIDLFCGIGGFRLAFERAGGRHVFSSDWNEKAQETYEANFGERPHGDIYSVAEHDIPPHNIFCAGFPCQPFSIAGVSKKLSLGKKHGFEDKEQGNLFFKLADLIDHHQPEAFVLENVKHLTRHDKGRTFQIIHDTLTKALGYHVHHRVIDARSVVPQHRALRTRARHQGELVALHQREALGDGAVLVTGGIRRVLLFTFAARRGDSPHREPAEAPREEIVPR